MSWRVLPSGFPRRYTPFIWLFVFLIIIVILFFTIPPSYENRTLFLLTFMGSGLLISYLVNSHWARDLEKRKKMYEIKLELYSDLYICLEGLVLTLDVLDYYGKLEERFERREKSEDMRNHAGPELSLSEYCGLVQELKGLLGEDLQWDIWDELSGGSFMGIPFSGFEALTEDETVENIKKAMEDRLLDLMRCLGSISTRLNRNMSRIFVMKNEFVAKRLHILRDIAMNQEFGGQIANREQLRSLVDDIEKHLQEDLDETL